jgi:hypothetical protein
MRHLVLIAGDPSHGPGEHEFQAGAMLLQRCLTDVPDLATEVCVRGWPASDDAITRADAIVIFADGGRGHPILVGDRLELLRSRVAAGMGIGFMHYAVEVPADDGADDLRSWIGGVYEDGFSCNPIWDADVTVVPGHPITAGVAPFSARDEWYFSIRFREGFGPDGGVDADGSRFVPLLTSVPPDTVRSGPYVWPAGPYPHVVAAAGRREVMMWALERADGGRGFGMNGGHFHENWATESFRRVVLNAAVWLTGLAVPSGGVLSDVTDQDLRLGDAS